MPRWRKEMLPAKRLTLEPSFRHLAGCQTVVGLNPEFWTAEKRINNNMEYPYEEKSLLALVMIQLFFQTTNSFGSSLIKSQNKNQVWRWWAQHPRSMGSIRQLVTSSNGASKNGVLCYNTMQDVQPLRLGVCVFNWGLGMFWILLFFPELSEIHSPRDPNTMKYHLCVHFSVHERTLKDPESCAMKNNEKPAKTRRPPTVANHSTTMCSPRFLVDKHEGILSNQQLLPHVKKWIHGCKKKT